MNKLTTTLAAIALMTTAAYAEGYKTPVEPEPTVTVTDNGVDLLPLLLIILGAVVVASIDNTLPAPLDEPRPLVRPEMCMDKVGGVDMMVACDD